jgi:uncharacterized ParB-like nuclease family protein
MRVLLCKVYLGQRREKLDRKKVTRLQQASLRRGDPLPPIEVRVHRPGFYELLDGWHRVHAHRREGRGWIQAAARVR